MAKSPNGTVWHNITVILVLYVVAIVAGAVLALGLDAAVHFVNWTPYGEFPWKTMRVGIIGGFVILTFMLVTMD